MNNEATNGRTGEATSQGNCQSTEETSSPNAQGSEASSGAQKYTASIYPEDKSTIPPALARAVLRLEDFYKENETLTTQVWLLVQPGKGEDGVSTGRYAELNKDVRRAFFSQREELSQAEQIVLLIDSTGGSAKAGYQLATLLRRYCSRLVALVPNVAKSAATLLAIGADKIILGNSGELGPVDAQVLEGTRYVPALDRVKALERLHASALEALDRTMALLTLRSEQNIDELIPIATDFAARLAQPYLRKQDMMEYTRMSRVQKIGEDYANRLLYRQSKQEFARQNGYRSAKEDDQPNRQQAEGAVGTALHEDEWLSDYSDPSKRRARSLAQHLAGYYPDHDFAIDVEEARRIGLQVRDPSTELEPLIDELYQVLADRSHQDLTAIGRVRGPKVG
jgi:hypothetical protein